MSQTIVLGFNSASYDLNVVKRHLIRLLMTKKVKGDQLSEGVELGEEEEESDQEDDLSVADAEEEETLAKTCKARVIKRNNVLMMIATKSWRLLDITNYLAPTSYSGYLKAFKIKEEK